MVLDNIIKLQGSEMYIYWVGSNRMLCFRTSTNVRTLGYCFSETVGGGELQVMEDFLYSFFSPSANTYIMILP